MDGMTVADAVAAYPRMKARTVRFTLGAPRSATALEGGRALFLRSSGAEDAVTSLWMSWFDGDVHRETPLADPRLLLGVEASEADVDVPDEEKARRERARESAEGIVSYSVDAVGGRVAFAVGGRLWVTCIDAHDPARSVTRELAVSDFLPVINPRIAPDGSKVAYTTGREMVVVDLAGVGGAADGAAAGRAHVACRLADDVPTDVTIGLAEFAAGEEMDRYEGFWWSPDSRRLLVERADESAEPRWFISDPANPANPPRATRYPQALTRNAEVRLFLCDADAVDAPSIDGLPEVQWDHEAYEYLAVVRWNAGGEALLLVQNRLQTDDRVLAVCGTAGGCAAADGDDAADRVRKGIATRVVAAHHGDYWMDLIHGTPAWTPDGRLVTSEIDVDADTVRVAVDGRMVSPGDWQVLEVLDVGDSDVLARATRDPRGVDVVSFPIGSEGEPGEAVVLNPKPGVWSASRSGDALVLSGRTMDDARGVMTHIVRTADAAGSGLSAGVEDRSALPGFTPNTHFVRLGADGLYAAITLPTPSGAYSDAASLPVLMKPYGGPMHREVLFNQAAYRDAQWWADQGFIVVAADGHGTGARGLRWDHAIYESFADVTLGDQVAAVRALPEAMAKLAGRLREEDPDTAVPMPDLDRVAMIGWSYGGFMSALAVLRAPDVFHAACAGAPPTDWTLYDTHYTERYLGLDPEVYRRNSLIGDAPALRRPLMLIHGFADDNVSVANSLRLSSALLAAGRDHTVLPLTGITHMTNDETVAENLLILQRDFLRKALG